MPEKMRTIRKRMGARAAGPEQPLGSPSAQGLDPAVVNTVVRRLGGVALAVFNTIMSNLVSSGRDQYAEALNDSLKPLVDCLLHFELLDGEADTETDHEVP